MEIIGGVVDYAALSVFQAVFMRHNDYGKAGDFPRADSTSPIDLA